MAALSASRARPAPKRWRAPRLQGATPQGAFDAVARTALAQIEANARGVLASTDPEYLHQLRVGQRRLRSALRAFRPILPRREAKHLKASLRALSPKLGAARDWDVLAQRLAAARKPALVAKAQPQREKARQVARRAIESKKFTRLPAQARAIEPQQCLQSLAEFGAAGLERAYGKVLRMREIDWNDAAARHALRIRVKRLRYSCEFFASAFPARTTTAYAEALKQLQGILGKLNDIAVGRRLIGFTADETALLRSLRTTWTRFLKRRPFWHARA